MNVKSVAGANIHAGLQKAGGAGEIVGPGDFQVIGAALGNGNVQPGGAGDFDIVGCGPLIGGVGRTDRGKVKALRGLRGKKLAAVLCACDRAIGAEPKRICYGQAGSGGGVLGEGVDHTFDHFGTHAGAGGVMDQHFVGVPHSCKPTLDGIRALGPSGGHGDALGGKGRGVVHIIAVQYEHNLGDLRHGLKSCQCMVDHPRSGQRLPLFGLGATRTAATACGDN